MNELELSTNLQEIELEIQWHKENAGRSVWEIGRRLKHVKEKDLVHGEFGKWLERINIGHREANRMMKVSEEIPYSTTWSNLGNRALYLISTLPEEEREKEHTLDSGETKKVNDMTTRELEEVKRKNREQAQTIEEQQKVIDEQANQKPEVIEKEITKEVIPHDYDGLKSDNQQLSQALREAQKEEETTRLRNKRIEKERDRLQEDLNSVDEKSQKYDQLNEAMQELNGKLNDGQRRLKAQKEVYDLIKAGERAVIELAPLSYLIDAENVMKSEYARKPIEKLMNNLDDISNRLSKALENTIIIEG